MATSFTEDPDSTEVMATPAGKFEPFSEMLHLRMFAVSLIGVVGIVGNALTLVVYTKYNDLGSKSHCAMVRLQATVDLLSSVMLILQEGVVFGLTNGLTSFQSLWMCKLFGSGMPFGALNVGSSISLVALTANRYVHTVHPNCSWRCWWKWPLVCLFMGLALVLSAYCLVTTTGFVGPMCVPLVSQKILVIAGLIVNIVILYFLPTVLFIYCYATIYMVLRRSHRSIYIQPTGLYKKQQMRQHKVERNVAVNMALVCLMYFVCSTPINVLAFIQVFLKMTELERYFIVAGIIGFSNSCINPIIYGFKHRGFRVKIKHLFCGLATNA